MKLQAHSSLGLPLEYVQNQANKSSLVMTILIILGIMEMWYCFRLVLEGKTGKEIPKCWRLEFLEKFLANNFALSDAEDHTSGLLNSRLSFWRTLLAICKKSREPSF